MRKLYLLLTFIIFSPSVFSQGKVSVVNDGSGSKLVVDGKDFIIKGMNWDYYPIGTNYTYNLWNQPDEFIKQALDDEMSLLKNMGVNTIRVYNGMPKKWIEYVYVNYGIYTMINHPFGRYGLDLNGGYVPNTEYSDAKTREFLLNEANKLATEYKDTKGLLLFLLGNENNYGLFWDGAETQNIPVEQRKSTKRAEAMYKLFDEAAVSMKKIDASHPIAFCNGDLMFLDIINKECQDFDIFATNVYRGTSFGDLFERVKKEYGKPVLFSEFGADAFNALTNQEDQTSQSYYLLNQWKEIYQNAAGVGKAQNALGGFVFQFSDGWWKYGQTSNLDVHDSNASWASGGYLRDYEQGQNNMNEEWFGICAKGPTNEKGFYELYPRSAYYVLKETNNLNPYAANTSAATVENYFNNIQVMDATLRARGDKASLEAMQGGKIKISSFRAEFTTFNTGGSLITTPDEADPNSTQYPDKKGFDNMESVYVGIEGKPSNNMQANVEFNVLGHVATNPIDEIFYENRGRVANVQATNGSGVEFNDINRVQIYRASYKWNSDYFNLTGFYRTGHYHWGYEGDFFGLYPEANYGPNIDIYNGIAPYGFEMEGKKIFSGLKLAFGPQLWWGANPAVLLKYSKHIGKFGVTGIFHEDLEQNTNTQSSFAIPQPKTRRFTLAIDRKFGKFGFDLGGIWAGQPLNGRTYQFVRGSEGNEQVYESKIESKDNFGGKVKFTYTGGKFNWYGQGAAMGLVANGGADYTQTFTGWKLKDSGSGNQYNFLSGFTYSIGKLQIAPNFLYQKPLEGPIDNSVPAPGRPRNILDDPFVVRANREQTAGEILFTYDPTPGTWMYDWDNDRTEDAKFAVSAGFVFRHYPTTQDAAIGILPDGRTTFAFDGAAPAKDLYEVNARIISKWRKDFGIIANVYTGDAQANGSDARTIHRYGMDLRMIYRNLKLTSSVKINDWGPYDYHRDFNLTYPLQLMADLSIGIEKPDWFLLPGTRIGIRGTWRSLDQYSPRYNPTQILDPAGNWVPDPTAIGFPNGNEWEIRTYVHINIIN